MSGTGNGAKTKKNVAGLVVLYEALAYVLVIAIIWMDEVFDLPRFMFNAPGTPINWKESLFESILVLCLAIFTIVSTVRIINRLRYLEGFMHVCSFCKKIEIDGVWIPIEQFIAEHSEAVFSHGLCPDCMKQHYGQFVRDDDEKKKQGSA